MSLPRRYMFAALVLCGLLTSCSFEAYLAKPLRPEQSAQEYTARTLDDAALRHYLRSNGVAGEPWPPSRWRLSELTLVAFYFHPDLAVARERVAVARASLHKATERAPLEVAVLAEHHNERTPQDDGPWSLGFELELPMAGASRREAIVEGERAALERAELEVGAVAWQVRARLRAALVELYSARGQAALAGKEHEHNEVLVRLLQRRLQEGAVSSGEVTAARLRSHQARADAQSHALAATRAWGDLAAALALPLEVTRRMGVDFSDWNEFPPAPDGGKARAQALLNRLDIRAGLLDYAIAESHVRLEVARQYPALRWSPGFLWDQGDAVWSLGLGLIMPATVGNRRSMQLAQAQREFAARRFEQSQQAVMAQTATTVALYDQALQGLRVVEAQKALSQQHLKETEGLFAGGYADRVRLTQGQLESVGAARAAWQARRAALDAWGELENVLQAPWVNLASPIATNPSMRSRP
ncbi:MAG: TolC family protein [Betaproteobacteria bacterium]|nr:TolC family protein [Betaproteobacteria bacterium]